ncbi:GSCFA domain-containing protein [Arenibacter palladensis]|uniref:GSCFA domain-containing protein n=1 Tax=Arenibacter palladensis TaxID=237373 RepID=UPI0026E42F80|nr:GSCFA domain-containing protein [Arenibacter palladensis]MDO6604973.1 GSCFA domain-containing protein [Arenibacter palladensis]
MKLQTQVPLNKATNQIDYSSQLVVLGSCFANNIGDRLAYYKFRALKNPFGILFHPLAIENLISRAIQQKQYTEEEVFFLNERWQCYDAHSDLSSVTKEELLGSLNSGLLETKLWIAKASHIFITLGTAWTYQLKESGKEVANCHKVPQIAFQKQLLSIEQIDQSLEAIIHQIGSVNEKAKIVFTVSPVRHLKDGFVENQQSKAHLISAVHHIIKTGNASYFPSYELMMDELRDYRFYGNDMVHPNDLAVNYIWEKFKTVWILENSYSAMDEVAAVQKGLHHRPFNLESEKHKEFLETLDKKIANLQKEYPFMKF